MMKIEITRTEGPSELCGKTIEVASYAAASKVLRQIAETAPEGGGYNKVDFIVTFDAGGMYQSTEGGDVYQGRVDIDREHALKGYDLRAHMANHLKFTTLNPALIAKDQVVRAHELLDKHFRCTSCLGVDFELLNTVVLGNECVACRKVRRENPGPGAQAAVDARRAANLARST